MMLSYVNARCFLVAVLNDTQTIRDAQMDGLLWTITKDPQVNQNKKV